MTTLETVKNYLRDLREMTPRNLMIPVVISVIGILIFVKKRVGF